MLDGWITLLAGLGSVVVLAVVLSRQGSPADYSGTDPSRPRRPWTERPADAGAEAMVADFPAAAAPPTPKPPRARGGQDDVARAGRGGEPTRRFADRAQAGSELGHLLQRHGVQPDLVLAIPLDGVLVAEAVAAVLGAPLEVLDVQDVKAHREDLGVGAVTSVSRKVRMSSGRSLGMSDEEIDEKARERQRDLRGVLARVQPHPGVLAEGRRVVVVDDALEVTAAAVEAANQLRVRGAAQIVLAVPVGISGFLDAMEEVYDGVWRLAESAHGLELENWYEDLPPVTEDDVVAAVERSQPPR